MRHFMLVTLCLAAVACTGQATPTSPSSATSSALSSATSAAPSQATAQSHSVDVTFTKWFPAPGPVMAGITDEGGDPGTYAGILLRRTVLNDQIAELEAQYQVINPSGHSFTALIEGKSHIPTGHATLNGVVTAGWSVGAQVHVSFDRVSCTQGFNGFCFVGTIRVMQGSAN